MKGYDVKPFFEADSKNFQRNSLFRLTNAIHACKVIYAKQDRVFQINLLNIEVVL